MANFPQVLARFFAFGLVGAFVSCAAKPTPSEFEGRRITRVTIRQKLNGGISKKGVQNVLERELGKTYADARIDRAMLVLMETGFIEDVRLFAEPTGNGVAVIAEVTPLPPMGPSGFVGNTAFSDVRLAKASGIQGALPVGQKTIEEGRRNIEAFYRQQGYDQVKVSSSFPKHMVLSKALWQGEFRFVIEEGPRYR